MDVIDAHHVGQRVEINVARFQLAFNRFTLENIDSAFVKNKFNEIL